jgi:hypothetical protein
MITEKPKIASSRDGNFRQLWYSVFVGQAIVCVLSVEELSQFHILESCEAEIEIRFPEILQFQGESFFVPIGPRDGPVHHESERLYLCR